VLLQEFEQAVVVEVEFLGRYADTFRQARGGA
jgi:hypothetical protein